LLRVQKIQKRFLIEKVESFIEKIWKKSEHTYRRISGERKVYLLSKKSQFRYTF